jgi:biopolymer transport protein ExbB
MKGNFPMKKKRVFYPLAALPGLAVLAAALTLGAPSLNAQSAPAKAAAPAAAKEAAPAADAKAAAPTDAKKDAASPAAQNQSFYDVVMSSGVIGISIWLMIFATSAATLGLIIDACINFRRSKIMPMTLVTSVRDALDQGDLGAALEACEKTPGPLANILRSGFNNVSEGFEVIMESISTTAEIESEKIMQRVNYLNVCGALAPMLGLMGTVTGMVDAFSGLATTTGAEKAQMLALAISQALYTTAWGLLIAVPAILAYVFIKNYASRIILDMESLTYDLVKGLRGAEVVEEDAQEAQQ